MSYPETQTSAPIQLAYSIKQHTLVQQKTAVLQGLEIKYDDGLLNDQELSVALVEAIEEAVESEKKIRKSAFLDQKPSFVSTQLENLLARLKKNLAPFLRPVAPPESAATIASDERVVYIYLFNAQGQSLRGWRTSLSPAVFKGSSVHHPVYSTKAQVQHLIRTKRDPSQHGFVEVKVKKSDVINEDGVDDLGQPLVRLKYGVLDASNILSFVTMENAYTLEKDGSLKAVV